MAVASSIIAASIIAGATAGTSIYAAKKQGEANQQGIDAQTQANNEALQFEKDQLAYQQKLDADKLAYEHQLDQIAQAKQAQLYSDLGPYRSLSAGSLASLANMTGQRLPTAAPPSVSAVPTGAAVSTPPAPMPALPTTITAGVDRVQAPNSYSVSGLTTAPVFTGGGGPSSYVRLQAPDGSIRAVPWADAQQLQQQHADLKVVNA